MHEGNQEHRPSHASPVTSGFLSLFVSFVLPFYSSAGFKSLLLYLQQFHISFIENSGLQQKWIPTLKEPYGRTIHVSSAPAEPSTSMLGYSRCKELNKSLHPLVYAWKWSLRLHPAAFHQLPLHQGVLEGRSPSGFSGLPGRFHLGESGFLPGRRENPAGLRPPRAGL